MSWSEGRRLSSLTTGGNTTTYTYDLNGLRNKKVNADGTWVKYFIADGKIIGETLYRANNTEVYDMRYTFDENGDVCGISIWRSNVTGWEKYYFLKSLQGDVLAIYKASDTFTKVGEYTYDSWGNVLSVTGVPSNDNAATLNPFRYRSYYHDSETGFYYLQSRYYDPAIGRFVNSDEFTSTGQDFAGFNMFAYCGNNPVDRKDDEGTLWIVSVLVGVAIQYASDVATNVLRGKRGVDAFTPTSSVGTYISAGITAVIPGSGFGNALISNIISEGISVIEDQFKGKKFNLLESMGSVALGTMIDTGLGFVSDKTVDWVKSKSPTNYSSYAHKVRTKKPDASREAISRSMKHVSTANRIAQSAVEIGVNFLNTHLRRFM